ncbi:MAG: hypothetical protein M1820_005703 [Bogoriella megaspora]|nr:MAG: hypothetical protein M1820_005703 [Bogoriella megaspora]
MKAAIPAHFLQLLVLIDVAGCLSAPSQPTMQETMRSDDLKVDFDRSWKVLGPFQSGTREATWGTDPLEYHGGFHSLVVEKGAQFSSSLAPNGSVTWSEVEAETISANESGARTKALIAFPDLDWKFQQAVYGWSALQYQAWARTNIQVHSETTQTMVLYTDQILEFWVDGAPYFGGDLYEFHRAPLVLHLEPGAHQFDLRLVREVRAMGGKYGSEGPSIDVNLEIRVVESGLYAAGDMLLPDFVNSALAGSLGSAPLQNAGNFDIEVFGMTSANSFYDISLLSNESIRIAPGQVRPVAFNVSLLKGAVSPVEIDVWYKIHAEDVAAREPLSIAIQGGLREPLPTDPHKITYLHPGGIVSYAILRPPSKKAQSSWFNMSTSPMPIFLFLHGAGIEADNELIVHSFDAIPDLPAWTLLATGVTSWSGDDWHTWGFTDVEAAIRAIPSWISLVDWDGVGVDVKKWLVAGHSNGGQGARYAAAHRPDNIIALAPASGYASIQSYVPYTGWVIMDPRKQMIIQASLNSYRHELMAENLKGIPILQQHGSADDNVPVWHSRAMRLLIEQAGWMTGYSEVSGAPHWWDGVMTTEPLRKFYAEQINQSAIETASQTTDAHKRISFSIIVANPGDMGSKGGVKVTHLVNPDQYGKVQISSDSESYEIQTSNILSFEAQVERLPHASVLVDGERLRLDSGERVVRFWKGLGQGDAWRILQPSEKVPATRTGHQLGPMDALLRSNGPFKIRDIDGNTPELALQISRNLYQYFGADANLTRGQESIGNAAGNVIDLLLVPSTLGIRSDGIQKSSISHHQVHDFLEFFYASSSNKIAVKLRLPDESSKVYSTDFGSWGLGGITLSPLNDERLRLVIWGTSLASLRFAARFVPMLTGVGQPDFIVFDKRIQWKGAESVLAMGFFDHRWKVTKASFIS